MFKKKHGHMNVPLNAKKPWNELGIWVDKVRALKRNNKLRSDRVEKLNKIDFRWLVDGETLENTDGLLNETEFIKKSKLWMVKTYRLKGLIKPIGYAMSGPGISPYYHSSQIAQLKKTLGITLDDTKGLLTELRFGEVFGSPRILYRNKGLLKPVGYGISSPGVTPFYHPRQVVELKKTMGITLNDTKGLLTELQFAKAFGCSRLKPFRVRGLISPIGYALSSAGLSPYYQPHQITELKKALGITLDDTKGLLTEKQFGKTFGSSRIGSYRKRGLITPVGYALSTNGVAPFYHPRQITELKIKMGISLTDTKGLLNQYQIALKFGLTKIDTYRKKGLIIPRGYGFTTNGVSPFYTLESITKLKKKLGITIDDTKGLLNEKQIRKITGFSHIGNYRKKRLIIPIGYAMSNSGVSPYYHPRQLIELKRNLGITLGSTKGLINENQFKRKSGLSQIAKYRKAGIIVPVGKAFSTSTLSYFYRPSQILELKSKLGITIENTKGLLHEEQICKLHFSNIRYYRKIGIIKPFGYGMTRHGVGPFYHPKQIAELKRKIGITLKSTKGLLNEAQFKKAFGSCAIKKYREKGFIKPVGFAMTLGSRVSAMYHPRQIKELKLKLGITIDDTKGLLNEKQIRKITGFSHIGNYRKKRLIIPIGYAMSNSGVSPYYHPRQIKELRAKLKKIANKKSKP